MSLKSENTFFDLKKNETYFSKFSKYVENVSGQN